MNTPGTVATRLLSVLEGRAFVTASLRNVLEALPDDPSRNRSQVDAAAAMVVLNAWISCGEGALDLLRSIDDATGGALALYPRDEVVVLARPEDAARLNVALLGLATKLGFGPAHRVKVATVVTELGRALAARGGRVRAVLAVHVGAPRRITVRLEEEMPGRDGDLGSGRALGLHRVRATADEVQVRTDERGRLHVVATFRAAPRSGGNA